VNDKTDVYSFGVVLLELITGCRPSEPESCKGEEELVGWARPLLDERNLDKLVDPQLGHMYNVCQMQAMISAAALCVRQSLQHRPQISQVNLFHRASLSIMRNLDLMHLIPSLLSKSTSCKKVIHQSFCIR
jgi:serine/threonine protein kinase